LLFLNNNLHAVHHERPSVPWYKMRSIYRAERERLLRREGDYRHRSYWEIMRRYFFHPKEPVLWPLERARG
jgi:fatty acid desaturase